MHGFVWTFKNVESAEILFLVMPPSTGPSEYDVLASASHTAVRSANDARGERVRLTMRVVRRNIISKKSIRTYPIAGIGA